jgi:tetratricopeptide (TPR) repeat protein
MADSPDQPRGSRRALELFSELFESFVDGRRGPRAIWISGPPGAGKTSLLHELASLARPRCAVVEARAEPTGRVLAQLFARIDARDDEEPIDGLLEVIEARQAALALQAPQLLLIDDVQRLDAVERGLLVCLLRLMERTDTLFFGLSASDPAPIAAPALRRVPLEPAALTAAGAPARADRLHERLGREERRVMALFLAAGEPLSADRLTALEVQKRSLSRLCKSALLRADRDEWRLDLSVDVARLSEQIASGAIVDAHQRLAEEARARLEVARLDALEQSRVTASLIAHLDAAGREVEAAELLLTEQALAELCPEAWADVAASLSTLRALATEPAVLLTAAEIEQSAGRAEQALRNIEVLLWRDLDPDELMRAKVIAAASHLSCDRLPEARRDLEIAFEAATEQEDRARIADILSQVIRRQGDAAGAITLAEAALEEDLPDALAAPLHLSIALAASRLGQRARALRRLRRAAALFSTLGQGRALTETKGQIAQEELDSGRLGRAIDEYGAALDMARRGGFDDLVAPLSSSLGEALQRRGEWDQARRCFELGSRFARALGSEELALTLHVRCAALERELGQVESERPKLLQILRRLDRGALTVLARHALTLEGTLAELRAQLEEREVELARLRPSDEPAATREDFEAQEARRILTALNEHRWNVRAVSRALDIPSNTLYRRLKKYGITRPRD